MSENKSQPTAVYKPDIFDVEDIARAMRVTVTAESGTTTRERWEKETAYLVDDIGQRLGLHAESCVLDYGCGLGRIAKGLIEKYGCHVFGIDFSKSMRLLAPEYVLSDRFNVWSPEVLDQMISRGFRADAAICLWVIQHALDPMDVIHRIHRSLRMDGSLYSLNDVIRCVPTDKGFVNDGFDVAEGLRSVFREQSRYSIPEHATTPGIAASSMIQILVPA